MVGVVPNAAYRHFAGRDELLAAVCTAAMGELANRMAAGTARVRGKYGDPTAATPGWARSARRTWNSLARNQDCSRPRSPCRSSTPTVLKTTGRGRTARPWASYARALDELVDAGVLDRQRRDGIEYPVWSAVHGMAVLAGEGPLRAVPDATRRHLEELTLAFIADGLTA